jgi:hypothetical protein
MTGLVDLTAVGVDVGGDLGLQRGRQHLPGPVAHDRIKQRRTRRHGGRLVGLADLLDYLEHGRTFPSQRANADPDQNLHGLQIMLGRYARFTSPRRGPSTGSDHCSESSSR